MQVKKNILCFKKNLENRPACTQSITQFKPLKFKCNSMDNWYKNVRGMGTFFFVKEHHIKDPKITKPSPHYYEREK